MNARALVVTMFLVGYLTSSAQSQDKVPQIGQWVCKPADFKTPGDPPLTNFPTCITTVTFDSAFGADPNKDKDVAVSITTLPVISPSLFPTKVTVASATSIGLTIHVQAEHVPNSPVLLTPIAGYYVAWGYLPSNATVIPKFMVLSVIYAPPGSTNSSVTYNSGNTSSMKLSASDSFSQDVSTSVEVGTGVISADFGLTYSKSTTDQKSLDVQQSLTTGIKYTGPTGNGLNHDYDQFLVWLNPEVDLTVNSSSVDWTLKSNEQSNRIVPVLAGCLMPTSTVPPTMCSSATSVLAEFSVTPAEYPQILQTDPFINGSPLDPNRYIATDSPFLYAPTPDSYTLNLTDSSTSTLTSSAKNSYEVDASVTAGGDKLGGKIKVSTKWTWTNEVSNEKSTGTSSSAVASFGSPSSDMGTGKRFLQVYLDTIYRTFAFGFVPDVPPAVSGTVIGTDGKPVGAGIEVMIQEEGTSHLSYSPESPIVARRYRVSQPSTSL